MSHQHCMVTCFRMFLICFRMWYAVSLFMPVPCPQAGLVDFVGTPEEVDRELRRLLSRFRTMDSELLEKGYTKCPAGNVDQALLAMGSLDKRDRVREREPDALVNLSLDPETGVCVLTATPSTGLWPTTSCAPSRS